MASLSAAPGASPAPLRCSTCAVELSPEQLRDHVCSNGTPFAMQNSPVSAPAPTQNTLPPMFNRRPDHGKGKLPKFAPPRIDPFAANDAFLPSPQSTPGLNAASGMSSPASSRFRMPPRSATAPYFRERSKSPVLRIPQDSAFPVFPTKKVRQERARKELQRSKSMSRSQSRSQSRDRSASSSIRSFHNPMGSRAASPAAFPIPPRPSTAGNGASRANSLSNGRIGQDSSLPEVVPPLPLSRNGTPTLSPPALSPPMEIRELPAFEARSQTSSPAPQTSSPPSMAPKEMSSPDALAVRPSPHYKQPSISASIKPLDAIGSARKPGGGIATNGSGNSTASVTPKIGLGISSGPTIAESGPLAEEETPHHLGLAPGLRNAAAPDQRSRLEQPSNQPSDDNQSNSDLTPEALEKQILGSMERIRNSASSDESSYSATHSASSRSSPPTSAFSLALPENVPKPETAADDKRTFESVDPPLDRQPTLPDLGLMATPAPTTVPAPAPAPAPATAPEPISSAPAPLQQQRRGPAKSFSRPSYAQPLTEAGQPTDTASASNSPQPGPNLERFGSLNSIGAYHIPPRSDSRPSPSLNIRTAALDSQSPASASPLSPLDKPMSPPIPRTPTTPGFSRKGDQGFSPPRRPATPGFKGNCRGCGEMIVGKSVSSADGRLTGRYHKQCFVCQTCKESFKTADFYVLKNQPYCARHYHTLNGSLCNNCDRGIEGPYMETDAAKKFHPHCFTCKECHLILRDDFYEINGVIYCEKHSKKPELLGPGRRFPERRTTRLMMM